jgi:hypothetical protein
VRTATASEKSISQPKPLKRRGFFRTVVRLFVWIVLLSVVAGLIARPFAPRAILWYVNRTLSQSPLYRGKIGDIRVHLWRGAYTIENVRILKTTGDIPVPFFSAREIDLAIDWQAILHRKIVGQISLLNPQVNFVDDPSAGKSENGSGGPWLAMIRDLFPFDINSCRLTDGSVHFRTYQKTIPVDVYIDHLSAQVDDLTNVDRTVTPMLTTVNATGMAMDQAKFEMHIKLNPFSYNPTFHLDLRLLGLDITKTNPLIETYGGFNIKRGLFDLVMDIQCDEGQLRGYVKPLFRNMSIFNPVQDVKEDNPLQVFWQAIVGGTAAVVTNYNRDQLATLIPFTGDLKGPQINFLATVGNVLRNAFIRAYLPRLEQGQQETTELDFGPASIVDPISVGDQP